MKTIQLTINNQVRLLDAEMVEKFMKGEIVLSTSEDKPLCILFLKHLFPDDVEPSCQWDIYGAYGGKSKSWFSRSTSHLPAFPISSFFVPEGVETPSLEEQLAEKTNAMLQESYEIGFKKGSSAAVAREAKLREALQKALSMVVVENGSQSTELEKLHTALSDTTLSVLPVETSNKDAEIALLKADNVKLRQALEDCVDRMKMQDMPTEEAITILEQTKPRP